MALVILSSLLFFALLHSLFPVLNSIPLPYSFCLFIFTSYFLSFLALVLLFIFLRNGLTNMPHALHNSYNNLLVMFLCILLILGMSNVHFPVPHCVCVPFSSSCFRFVISFLLVKTRTKNRFERIGA